MQTLVGAGTSRPAKSGNCFSMAADDGKSYRIVNFYIENLEYCCKHGITLPVKLQVLEEGLATICDARIPDEWYAPDYCKVCCPERLLPAPQQARLARWRERGQLVDIPVVPNTGPAFRIQRFDYSKAPPKIPHVD